jgi:cytidine deaminase
MEYKELAKIAIQSKEKAYAPYSKFKVGAALLTAEGKVYQGANIENAAFGLTICAERTAVFKAVLEGEEKFTAIAIAGSLKGFTPPCGSCRQVMAELCGHNLDVVLVNPNEELKIIKLGELLPMSFDKDFQKKIK